MNNLMMPNLTVARNGRGHYARLPLTDLLLRIVEESDVEALIHFHDHRTVFRLHDEPRLLFAAFLDRLRRSAEAQSWGNLVSQQAYDLAIDKFSRLPRNGDGGVDCRRYFRAVLKVSADQPKRDELCDELMLAQILQRFVCRHFELSLKECRRNTDMTRYEWALATGSISLLLPRFLSGPDRRRWLEKHVPHPDRQSAVRVQMIIAEYFQSGCAVPFVDAECPEQVLHPSDKPGFFESSISIHGLAATVASEKADDRLLEQRPAIQQLGVSKLKALILHIFEAIGDGDYHEGRVAMAHGLSKSTLSRFAGSHWQSSMPDLWKNTAAILSSRKDFVELIQELGIRRGIEVLSTSSAKVRS